MKLTEAGNGIVFYPVPRYRRRNATAKIKTVNGLEGGDFPRSQAENTTRPLTGLIVGTDGKIFTTHNSLKYGIIE